MLRAPDYSGAPLRLSADESRALLHLPPLRQPVDGHRPQRRLPARGARAARSAGSPTCSSCSTTTTRRRTRRSSPATATARIVDCGRGSFELTGLKTEQAIGRRQRGARPALRGRDRPRRHRARMGGPRPEQAGRGQRRARSAGQGRRRHLPRLRRRRGRRAGRAHADQPSVTTDPSHRRRLAVPLASSRTDDRSPAQRLHPAPRRRAVSARWS